MTQKPRGYAQFVEIRESPDRVFAAFTDPQALRAWYAVEATVEPRVGGRFHVRLRDGRVRDAIIDVWEPGRRLRLLYMPDATLPPLGERAIVEDVLFDVKAGRTVVRVLGGGIPPGREWDAWFVWLRRAWTYWLHALKRHVEAALPPEAAK